MTADLRCSRGWLIGAVAGMFLLAALGDGVVPARGQVLGNTACPGLPYVGRPNGFERLVVSTASVSPGGGGGTTPFATAAMAVMVTETADIRFRDDGNPPTATNGLLIPAASTRSICGGSLENLRLIRDTAAAVDAVVQFTFYGRPP